MKTKISIEERLRRFLDKAKELPSDTEKNSDACYEALYHILIICRALEAKDRNIAETLSDWLAENKNKFRFCATDDDFEKIVAGIETRLYQIIEEGFTITKGNGLDVERYLSDLEMSENMEKKIKKNFLGKKSDL
jgi:hypothetical protein